MTLLHASEVADLFGITRVTFWHRRKCGEAPEPFARTSKGELWRESDVRRWQAEQAAALEAAQ